MKRKQWGNVGRRGVNHWFYQSKANVRADNGWLGSLSVVNGMICMLKSPSRVQLFAIPWTAACQASLFLSFPEFAQTHIWVPWCCPTISFSPLLPSFSPSIRVFTSELALHIRWPKMACIPADNPLFANEIPSWPHPFSKSLKCPSSSDCIPCTSR